MINKKRKIAAVAIALMLIGSNTSVMACADTAGEFGNVVISAPVDVPMVQIDTVAAQVAAEVEKAQAAAADAQAKAQAVVQAAVEAVKAQNDLGTGINIDPVVPMGLGTKVVNPANGDIIETSFDPVTKVTTSSMICTRKDAPDTLTVTSPSGTDTLITGDGDTFNCNAGYYGSPVAPLSLSAEYKSSLEIQLKNSSEMTGEINNSNRIQYVSMTLDKTSKWIVKDTSYLSALNDEDATLANIIDNGNTIYYNSSENANSWLGGKTYTLGGGGKLIPLK